MNEEGKIQAGILFCPADPQLRAFKLKAHNLNVDYNQTHEDETEKRARILSELIGEFGEGGFIQGPIAFHYVYSEVFGLKSFSYSFCIFYEILNP